MISEASDHNLEIALNNLLNGEPVAIPTETVYGLAAPINRKDAIEKVFSLKKRPFFDPLIVHIGKKEDIKLISDYNSSVLETLISTYWPGPLTIVLPKKKNINSLITSGLDTVGIRCPDHPLTLKLLEKINVPLAAPSANLFGETSPTRPEHVQNTWSEDEVYVLDGGECTVGIESTVIKLSKDENKNEKIEILRKGHITLYELTKVLPSHVNISYANSSESPGHTPNHYMPQKPLIIISDNSLTIDLKNQIVSRLNLTKDSKYKELILPKDPRLAARTLYSSMHELSYENIDFIIVKKNISENLSTEILSYWEAIWDRLYRAASLDLSQIT